MTRLGKRVDSRIRRPIALVAIAVILASLLAGSTFAYFTTNSVSASVITAGTVGLSLTTYQRDATGTLVPFSQEQRVLPATTVSLEPVTTNTKDQPIWVRMRVSIVVIMPDGTEQLVAQGQATGADEAAEQQSAVAQGQATSDVISLDFDTARWTYREGYWYYDGALQAGEAASPLFSQVKFSNDMGNEYQGATFRVDVSAQGVQAAHTGSSALEAIGWPEEE